MSTHSACALSFSLLTLLAIGVPGCSSGEATGGDTSSATSKPAGASTPDKKANGAAPGTAAPAPAAPANLTLSGTCLTKYKDDILSCNEFYGKIPDKTEAECTKDGGTFTSGATPCTEKNAIGKCEKAPADGGKLVEVAYKTSPGDAKGSCEVMGRKWTSIGK